MSKIIGGKYKNYLLPVIKQKHGENICRPSTAKFREALFSILTSGIFYENNIFDSAKVVDLFCGTGALGLEALSRGAKSLTVIDHNQYALNAINDFTVKLGLQEYVNSYRKKITRLEKSLVRYDLVFLDPPYLKNYITNILHDLIECNWLNMHAIIIVEASTKENVQIPTPLKVIRDKCYGSTRLLVLRLC